MALTGARGRLGSALAEAIGRSSHDVGVVPWDRPAFDLDDLSSVERLVARDRPHLVIHAAAWTDVDACARDPELARRRNGDATGALARASVAAGARFLFVSTNEVFDGARTDGRGYGVEDETGPINAYGESKLAGERAAWDAYAGASERLTIVRTAWLYGPPGNDFPEKIAVAARRAAASGEALRVVEDETGSPSYSRDVAGGIVDLIATGRAHGTHHLVNAGSASRAEWAEAVVRAAGIAVRLERIASDQWPRASRPPRWAVLDPGDDKALRPWRDALGEYLPMLLREPRLGILAP